MRTDTTNHVLLGARGRLGTALLHAIGKDRIVAIRFSDYADWADTNTGRRRVSSFLSRLPLAKNTRVFVATGIIDPHQPSELHDRLNFRLAENVILGSSDLGLRAVTFGTVMEQLLNPSAVNPYIRSKIALGLRVNELTATGMDALHIRLHTLFGGGPPSPFMLLGQIQQAIATNCEFRMTSGLQLREYHHVADECRAILALSDDAPPGTITLSHGSPIKLRDLAQYVFQYFKKITLLKLGTLPDPPTENYDVIFRRSAALHGLAFVDTLPAIVEWMRPFVSQSAMTDYAKGSIGDD